ncbi:MAG: hypothetical protein WC730_03670 [Patescibacteria group bacterium]
MSRQTGSLEEIREQLGDEARKLEIACDVIDRAERERRAGMPPLTHEQRLEELQRYAAEIITELKACLDETGMIPEWYWRNLAGVVPQAALSLAVVNLEAVYPRVLLVPDEQERLHVPTTTMRLGDKCLNDLWKRILEEDLESMFVTGIRQADQDVVPAEERPRGAALYVYYVGFTTVEQPPSGAFFKLQSLPAERITVYHLRMLHELTEQLNGRPWSRH